MSFQAYINNIKEKTGKMPENFKQLAETKGFWKTDNSYQVSKRVKLCHF